MGSHKDISYNEFPEQGALLHRRVDVAFHLDLSNTVGGTIVRYDRTSPGRTIIRLDDGRYVLSDECQYTCPTPPPIR